MAVPRWIRGFTALDSRLHRAGFMASPRWIRGFTALDSWLYRAGFAMAARFVCFNAEDAE